MVRPCERTLRGEIMPRHPAGIGRVFGIVPTPDGEGYAYTHVRRLDSRHEIAGLE